MRKVLTVLWYTRPKYYLFIKTERKEKKKQVEEKIMWEIISISYRFHLHYKDTPPIWKK